MKKSAKAGADGNMIVTPSYNKPTQAGILTHFRMIADSTDLPVILYDIPGLHRRADQVRDDPACQQAPEHPGGEGCEGDLAEVSRVLNQTDLYYFCGDDALVLPSMAIGATGLIGVTANLTPKPYRTLVDAVNRGDLQTVTAGTDCSSRWCARP